MSRNKMQPYTVLIQVSLFNQTKTDLTVLVTRRETLKRKSTKVSLVKWTQCNQSLTLNVLYKCTVVEYN